MAIVGSSSASVNTTIEYSLDGGGSWINMDSYTCNAPGCASSPTHDVSVPLPSSQRTDLVQVRAKVLVTTGCENCNTNSTNVSGSISVYDVQIVAQRPTFKLFLDVDGNFNPTNPQSDIDIYVPGSYLDGTSVPVPSSGTTLQTVTVIAAYVLPNGTLAAPPDDGGAVFYSLTNTSAFVGMAMNYGTSTAPDFQLVDVFKGFGADKTSRVSLQCNDYGGFTTVKATRGSDIATLRIPKDDNNNWLPDGGWKVIANGQLIGEIMDTGLGTGIDEDVNPAGNGVNGDGLVNFEEFRGFVVRGEHRRTNPFQKDLFISSNLPQNIGDANNLPVTKHWIYESEMNTTNRIINFNYTNSGLGGNVPNHFNQQGLMVIDGGRGPGGIFGEVTAVGSPNAQTGPVRIYTLFIRLASPPNNNDITVDPFDDEKTRQTIGHEVGHGVSINHRTVQQYPPGQLSVMVTGYFSQTTNVNDPAWNNIPHNYDATDQQQIQVR